MRNLVARILIAVFLLAGSAAAQKKYIGPRPPKADVPYLLHADKLVETESSTATESQEKDGTVYAVAGAASPVRTPVPEPIMIFQSDHINPDRLSLFRMEVRGGNRVASVQNQNRRKKGGSRPVFLMVTPLAPGLFKVEVNEILEDGEYCLSPEGSNQVFCFEAY